MLVALGCALLVALVMVISSVTRDPGTPAPGRVWSEEHGHWHDTP
jgi:hypothetical protein